MKRKQHSFHFKLIDIIYFLCSFYLFCRIKKTHFIYTLNISIFYVLNFLFYSLVDSTISMRIFTTHGGDYIGNFIDIFRNSNFSFFSYSILVIKAHIRHSSQKLIEKGNFSSNWTLAESVDECDCDDECLCIVVKYVYCIASLSLTRKEPMKFSRWHLVDKHNGKGTYIKCTDTCEYTHHIICHYCSLYLHNIQNLHTYHTKWIWTTQLTTPEMCHQLCDCNNNTRPTHSFQTFHFEMPYLFCEFFSSLLSIYDTAQNYTEPS